MSIALYPVLKYAKSWLNFSRRQGFVICVLCFFLLACTGRSSKHTDYTPAFSFDSSGKKIIIFGLPNLSSFGDCDLLVKYLNKNLQNSKIGIVACTDADEYERRIKKKDFDFILINGALIFEAEDSGYSVVAKMGDDDKYRSVIFVRNDSSINKISDLKGKTIATSAPQALAGTMMPLLFLSKNGLNVNKDIKRLISPSFESTIMNVYLGKCTAGAAKKDIVLNTFKQRPEIAARLSIKWETTSLVNSAILINNNTDKRMTDELVKLIITLHDDPEGKKALIPLGANKFEKADSNTYKPLKKFLKEYNEMIH